MTYMKRILCILGSMDAGGAETFLMKIYRNIDRNEVQLDFCVAKKEKNFYEDEIIEMGGFLHRITPKSKNIIKNFIDIKNIVRDNKYQYVLRVSQHSLSALELLAAKFGGAKKLAFRSSNSNNCGNKINLLVHYLFRPFLNLISNVKIAPSMEAAKYMFGNSEIKKGKVNFIHNALEYDKYKFNSSYRETIRKRLNVNDRIVIGHVGRFNYQKNHKFILEVFEKIVKENDKYILLLIGEGELKQKIIEYARTLKIDDKIIFMGIQKDVNQYYSAMDLYLFPSLFEGMPNTVIEAQAAGLNCILSDTITKEANITGNIKYMDLNASIKDWKNTILSEPIEHKDTEVCFKEKRYDIKDISDDFIKLF